jgi:hypothetical protein
MRNILQTATLAFTKLFTANLGSLATIVAPKPTTTEPTGDGIFDLVTSGQSASFAAIKFFGTRTSADNETFAARLTAWRKIAGTAGIDLWIPTPLLALSLTQGLSTGVNGAPVGASEYFADTIVVSTAFAPASYEVISPADDSIGLIKVDLFGSQKLQVQLARGTNLSCNGLAAAY